MLMFQVSHCQIWKMLMFEYANTRINTVSLNFAHFIFHDQEASFQTAEDKVRDNSNLFSDF